MLCACTGFCRLYLSVTLPRFDHRVLYCEIGGEEAISPKQSTMTPLDPDLEFADNLVEKKHHLIARNRRRGGADKDLKPNPTIRNQLTMLTQRCVARDADGFTGGSLTLPGDW